MVLDGRRPPYVPWSFKFTKEAAEVLQQHYAGQDLEDALQNHIVRLGNDYGYFVNIGNDLFRDVFGVVWDRSVDKDIGNVQGCVLKEPSLDGFHFPDPCAPAYFEGMEHKINRYADRFRLFELGFSLFERGWTLRGMENLCMDFIENPDFVRQLFHAIADYNIAQVGKAAQYDIDAVCFGDDWGQQRGLIMGSRLWHEFIAPAVQRMYDAVHAAGKYVFIHSCGDVDELFPSLIRMGVNCFNPFQPEVMDVAALMGEYRGRLTFHGGLSTQRTLPFGTPDDIRAETRRLIEWGSQGCYILSPAHSVEGDVPLPNMLAFIETAQSQLK
jgi:uroporphyrinogen decarboxylase